MCFTRLAENTGCKSRQKSPSGHHRTTLSKLSGYIFATKAHIDNRKKNLLSSNVSSRCSHNMVNFGPLTAEISSGVWGIPANFNGFRILAALLHSTQVVSVSETLRRWTGRHLGSAGRPSRWALAHISSVVYVLTPNTATVCSLAPYTTWALSWARLCVFSSGVLCWLGHVAVVDDA